MRGSIPLFAQAIEAKVIELHTGRKTWSKQAGLWLVYGFERTLGFIGAAEFECVVERAWKEKRPIAQAICQWFAENTTEKPHA